MDIIETGPRGTTLRDASPALCPSRFSPPRSKSRPLAALLSDALAGKVAPLDAARSSRLLQNPQTRFTRFRLCLNAGPRVFGYCLRNVPEEFRPISLAGRITYAGALASIAVRKLWRQEIGVVNLPGRFILRGGEPSVEDLVAIHQAGPTRYRLVQNGEALAPEAFHFALNNPTAVLPKGDVLIEELP